VDVSNQAGGGRQWKHSKVLENTCGGLGRGAESSSGGKMKTSNQLVLYDTLKCTVRGERWVVLNWGEGKR